MRRSVRIVVELAIVLSMAPGTPGATDSPVGPSAGKGSIRLEAGVFPEGTGRAGEELEAEVLDFRYAPGRWQTCIGLPDDPHKSIVGSDGGLYYDFGSGPYHGFGTRVLARLAGENEAGRQASPTRQSLLDPRVPIVVTETTAGGLALHQEAWAGIPDEMGGDPGVWGERRVDYLWLRVKNVSDRELAARIALQIGSTETLALAVDGARVVRVGGSRDEVFCRIRPAAPPPESASPEPAGRLTLPQAPTVNRDWASPVTPCHSRFRHVLVGWKRPIVARFRARPGESYRAYFGLIEGYHETGGIRPVEIRAEGASPRRVDLVGEHGRNAPAVLGFEVRDSDGDGSVELAVHPVADADDRNTILSALWVFPADKSPVPRDLLAGRADEEALALLDANSVPAAGSSLDLPLVARRLTPGEECRALVAFPRGARARLDATLDSALEERNRAVRYWQAVGLPYDRILVPDPAVQALIDSSIRNIYQAREIKEGRPAFQVGPTCYRGTWAADGPFIMEAITYLGRADEVRGGLELQLEGEGGPGGVQFSKKAGLRLWMIWRHAQLTGDRAWLERIWPKVEAEVRRIQEYREMTRSDPDQANFGLMPRGFGDGGLGGVHREYTNVYWTLAGLRAAVDMADWLGRPDRVAWREEYDDYWRAFDRARRRDQKVDSAGNTYVPVTMAGEAEQLPQRGAWAFLQSVYPGRVFAQDDALALGTMAMLDANQREGLIYGTGWLAEGIWNYAGSFYAHAHLWLGHGRKAAATLHAFGNHASPLLCWREEQNPRGEPERYVGDMPHNWASAEFIRLVRHLLFLERGRELHLLEGLPRSWTKAAGVTCLVDVPTTFGEIGLRMEMSADGKSATIHIRPPRRQAPEKLVLHLERFGRPVRAVRIGDDILEAGATEVSADRETVVKVELGGAGTGS